MSSLTAFRYLPYLEIPTMDHVVVYGDSECGFFLSSYGQVK